MDKCWYSCSPTSGPGKIIWPNGRVYDGNFNDDHIHGPGVFFAESGIVLKNQTWDKGEKPSIKIQISTALSYI